MSAHPVLWTSPTPLWGRFGDAGASSAAAFRADDQARPAILRFASDEFMDQLLAMLAADPRALGDVIARPDRCPARVAPTVRSGHSDVQGASARNKEEAAWWTR